MMPGIPMRHSTLVILTLIAVVAGCSSASRQGVSGSSEATARVALPPDRAAACFAHNAVEHSSALIAEVHPGGDRAEVIVRVKNGVLYATADFRRAGAGSTVALTLNVTTNSSRSELVDALLEGC
jgi:hypothetical protein